MARGKRPPNKRKRCGVCKELKHVTHFNTVAKVKEYGKKAQRKNICEDCEEGEGFKTICSQCRKRIKEGINYQGQVMCETCVHKNSLYVKNARTYKLGNEENRKRCGKCEKPFEKQQVAAINGKGRLVHLDCLTTEDRYQETINDDVRDKMIRNGIDDIHTFANFISGIKISKNEEENPRNTVIRINGKTMGEHLTGHEARIVEKWLITSINQLSNFFKDKKPKVKYSEYEKWKMFLDEMNIGYKEGIPKGLKLKNIKTITVDGILVLEFEKDTGERS